MSEAPGRRSPPVPAETADPGRIPGADSRQLAVEGVRFHLHRADPRRHRRTPPVLLLHGVPQTAAMWRELVPELARDRTVLAPDLKGLGGSEVGVGYDLATLVHELAALALHEVDGSLDVVGHDLGGVLALGLASARPDLVRRLVVIDAPYRRLDPLRAPHVPLLALPLVPELLFALCGRQLIRRALQRGWRADRPLDPRLVDHYVEAYADPARVRALLSYYRAAVRPRLRSAAGAGVRWLPGFGRSPAPSPAPPPVERKLVLWGAADPVLPLWVGESVVRDLGPDTTLVTVPGAGHFVVEEAPEIAVPAIAGFLREAATET